jgi:thiol peroxidase
VAQERKGVYFSRGNPLTLLGPEVKVGQKAPGFTAVDNGMQTFSLGSLVGKVKVIASVPSLDTSVCSEETKKFNELAKGLPPDVQVLTISMDLPFAQGRWCGANGVQNVKTVSDYRDRAFGEAYGVRVKETGLLARAVFALDRDDTVRHVEYLRNQGDLPNFDAALAAVKKIAG